MPTTRKMLPEFEFRVNVRYDQEFRDLAMLTKD